MNLCDYNYFEHLKDCLKGIQYLSFEALETQLDIEIRALNDQAIFNGTTKLPQVWQRVVNNRGITNYSQINFFRLSNF